MPIFDSNAGGTYSEIGSLWDVTAAGTAAQIGRVWDVTAAGVVSEVWSGDEVVFKDGANPGELKNSGYGGGGINSNGEYYIYNTQVASYLTYRTARTAIGYDFSQYSRLVFSGCRLYGEYYGNIVKIAGTVGYIAAGSSSRPVGTDYVHWGNGTVLPDYTLDISGVTGMYNIAFDVSAAPSIGGYGYLYIRNIMLYA